MKKLITTSIISVFLFSGCFKAGCDGVETSLNKTEPMVCEDYLKLADETLLKLQDKIADAHYGTTAIAYMERYKICKEELKLKDYNSTVSIDKNIKHSHVKKQSKTEKVPLQTACVINCVVMKDLNCTITGESIK